MREAREAEANSKHSAGGKPGELAHFGMISRGNRWLSVEGIPDAIPLTDCFLLAPGTSYILRDSPRTQARSFCEVAPRKDVLVDSGWVVGKPEVILRTGERRSASLQHTHALHLWLDRRTVEGP